MCLHEHRYPPDSISTILVNDVVRVRVVLQTLGHLFTICSQHQTSNDEVFPWCLAEEVCTEDEQCVEPSTSLVKTLSMASANQTQNATFSPSETKSAGKDFSNSSLFSNG